MSGGLKKGTGIWGVVCYQRLCVMVVKAHAPPRPWGFFVWCAAFVAVSWAFSCCQWGTQAGSAGALSLPWVVSLFSGQHCSGRPELVFWAATLTERSACKANHLIKDWLKISLQMFSHHIYCAVCSFGLMLRWSLSKFGEQSSHATSSHASNVSM